MNRVALVTKSVRNFKQGNTSGREAPKALSQSQPASGMSWSAIPTGARNPWVNCFRVSKARALLRNKQICTHDLQSSYLRVIFLSLLHSSPWEKNNQKRSSFCLIKSRILVSGQLTQAVLWLGQHTDIGTGCEQPDRGANCCPGWPLEEPNASEEKVKQQQCPKVLFINLETHSKTGFPQTGKTHKLSAEKQENESLP